MTHDYAGQEKLLVFCPQITDDTLLHFSRRGEHYKLRAFAGRFADRQPWRQPDAPTASEFLRIYDPKKQIDVIDERINLLLKDRWAAIVAQHNFAEGITSASS